VESKKCNLKNQLEVAMAKYSTQLKELLKTKIGYRDNNFGELRPERNAIKVIRHEILDLNNSHVLSEAAHFLNTEPKLSAVIKAIIQRFGKNAYALWLGTKEDIVKYYGDCLTVYKIPEDAVPISDLGEYGILFVSAHEFEKIERKDETH